MLKKVTLDYKKNVIHVVIPDLSPSSVENVQGYLLEVLHMEVAHGEGHLGAHDTTMLFIKRLLEHKVDETWTQL